MIGQFGINMLVPVFICSFLGIFLDQKLGTNFLVIILFFVGAVAADIMYIVSQGRFLQRTANSRPIFTRAGGIREI